MSSEVLGTLFKAQPDGKVMWVSVRGSSMRPVLTGGESLKVVRCSEPGLRAGEIALMLRADGALIAHLVTATSPLRTESFVGTPDAAGLEVLGRVVAIRRGSIAIPLPFVVRPALLGLQRAWRWAARSEAARAVHRLAVATISSERTAAVRGALGAIETDLLEPECRKEVATALSRWVTLSADALEALLHEAVVVGARRRRTLVGLAFVTPDGVLRHAFLQRRAQGMGVERSIVERAIHEGGLRGLAVVAAELQPSQAGFGAAAQALGLEVRAPKPSQRTTVSQGAKWGAGAVVTLLSPADED